MTSITSKKTLLCDENTRFLMEHALNKIDEGIIIQDETGRVLFASDKVKDLLGYMPEEIVGLEYNAFIHLLSVKGYDYTEIKAKIDADFLKQTSSTQKILLMHKSGQPVPLSVSSYHLSDGNLQSYRIVVFKDLREDLLVKVTNLVNSSLSLNEILQNTTTAVVEYMGLSSTAVFLLDEQKQELHLLSCNAITSKEEMATVILPVGKGAPGKIVATRQSVYVRNLRTDPEVDEVSRKFHADKSSIGYPLICNNVLLGVIAFDADIVRDFTDKEKEMFQNITKQVALAIYNAQLFSRLQHLSITDGLTGLYNHRYFHERLAQELARAGRSGSSIGLLMIDVDDFKLYNDAFGHVMGDELLREIAQKINKNVRNFDIVSRYGGEEFTVILLDCDKKEALNIAERVRASVEEGDFYYCQHPQNKKSITISIGLAMYPEIEGSKLVYSADQAMYRAKSAGKNRVLSYRTYPTE